MSDKLIQNYQDSKELLNFFETVGNNINYFL